MKRKINIIPLLVMILASFSGAFAGAQTPVNAPDPSLFSGMLASAETPANA